jgi:hypothetical protein
MLLPEGAARIWQPWVTATGVMIALAAFAPSFRRVAAWLLFVVLLAAPITFTNWWADPPTSGLLAFAIGLLWLSVLGHYLRGAPRHGLVARMRRWLRVRPSLAIAALIGSLRNRYRVPQHSRSP